MKPLLVALVLLAGTVVRADEPPAKRFFLSGQKHFDLGEYNDALRDFKEAYRLRDDPVFLYNIAQCQRLLSQSVDALRTYKSYLRRSPDAPNRAEVEHKITALEELVKAQEQASKAPIAPPTANPVDTTAAPPPTAPATTSATAADGMVTATAPPPHKQPIYKKWWLWTAVGVVVVAGVGIGLGVGLSRSSTAQFPGVSF